MPETLSIEQAMSRLQVSRRTIYYYLNSGLLVAKQVYRSKRILTETVERVAVDRQSPN